MIRKNVSASTRPWADLFKAQEAICRVAISIDRDILGRKVGDIMPVPQGDIMEDFRLWVPDEVIKKTLRFLARSQEGGERLASVRQKKGDR